MTQCEKCKKVIGEIVMIRKIELTDDNSKWANTLCEECLEIEVELAKLHSPLDAF